MAEAVRILTEGNWYVKRLNSLYSTVSGRLDFKINKRFDSLIWSWGCHVFVYKGGVYEGHES